MDFFELVVAIIALAIALNALNLQKKEIIKNGQINALIHVSTLLQTRIDYHSKIIDNLKAKNENWKGHADRINIQLRPLKEKTDRKLVALLSTHGDMPHSDEIFEAIQSRRNS